MCVWGCLAIKEVPLSTKERSITYVTQYILGCLGIYIARNNTGAKKNFIGKKIKGISFFEGVPFDKNNAKLE